ncbi:MAG: enoyl-CoA hydratase-related protein [Rubrivivax sp.]
MPSAENPDDVVQLRREGEHVAVVTLNRPHARNAVSRGLAQGLDRAVKAVEADDAVRVAVLTGNGPAFCAGADLKELAAGDAPLARSTPDGGFAGFVFAPRRKPWIAAVNGPAVAGGFEIVLACDLAVASSIAVFGLPEVKRGLSATAGGVFRLPRRLPMGVALEMIATGDPIDAARAERLGLVGRVVAPEQVLPEALALAARIAANAPRAVEWSLELAREALDFEEAELRRRADAVTQRILGTEDAREGPRAFAEHRAPKWTGA